MNALSGQLVSLTGRLASMTWAEAAELVRARGGRFSAAVTYDTTLLVIGQEGWPLGKSGKPTRSLARAKNLQAAGRPIAIETEEEFLSRLGLEGSKAGVHGTFSLGQLCRMLKIPRDRLRSWIQAGFIEPVDSVQGVRYFNFSQVAGVRALWELTRAGVSGETIRRSLDQLQRWVPSLEESLTLTRVLEADGKLLVRLTDGHLIDANGQGVFDFETPPPVLTATSAPDADDLWADGCAAERAGDLAEAARLYRDALLAGGPRAELSFNLGNVLYLLGQLDAAAERFRQAIELDNGFAAAWNNLGNVLADQGATDDALAAFARVLEIDPANADAHFNAAETLDAAGRSDDAERHWRAFLKLAADGEAAAYAHSRLADLVAARFERA